MRLKLEENNVVYKGHDDRPVAALMRSVFVTNIEHDL